MSKKHLFQIEACDLQEISSINSTGSLSSFSSNSNSSREKNYRRRRKTTQSNSDVSPINSKFKRTRTDSNDKSKKDNLRSPILKIANNNIPNDMEIGSPVNSSPEVISSPKNNTLTVEQCYFIKRHINSYTDLKQIGEGSYGKVYKARDKYTNQTVAIKRIRNCDLKEEGFPISAIREIKILRQLIHPNIVSLQNVVCDFNLDDSGEKQTEHQCSFYLVFEYLEHDLAGLLASGLVEFDVDQVRFLFRQLLLSLEFCHSRQFLHRDLKCSNILISSEGKLKLADFGLSRIFETDARPYTNKVITLWYRPPELLLGEERYGTSVDIWSAGCILAELFIKRVLFPGDSEARQLELIFNVCGSPNTAEWPGVDSLPLYKLIKFNKMYSRNIKYFFKASRYKDRVTDDAIQLIDKMLVLNPKKRVSARNILETDKFILNKKEQLEKITLPQDSQYEYINIKKKQTKNSL